jgi:hypothetical protein
MTAEQVEQRFRQLETEMEEVRSRLSLGVASAPTPDPKSRWWELLPAALPAEDLRELDARAKYFRQTGEYPPPVWKPGDPIPEPDHWQ